MLTVSGCQHSKCAESFTSSCLLKSNPAALASPEVPLKLCSSLARSMLNAGTRRRTVRRQRTFHLASLIQRLNVISGRRVEVVATVFEQQTTQSGRCVKLAVTPRVGGMFALMHSINNGRCGQLDFVCLTMYTKLGGYQSTGRENWHTGDMYMRRIAMMRKSTHKQINKRKALKEDTRVFSPPLPKCMIICSFAEKNEREASLKGNDNKWPSPLCFFHSRF